MRPYICWVLVPGVWVLWAFTRPARALPTMVRLGYSNCAVCHISPQGGGLLNAYGRSIDQAQSLRGGDYQPSNNRFIRWLSWGDHITQDLRSVTQEQISTATDEPLIATVRARFLYRNATELGRGWRISAVINGENRSAKRPDLSYEPPVEPKDVYLTSALISYRPKGTLEFSAGRDPLPSGVNNPDLSTYIRARNRYGYYDAPLQFKMFWWGKHYQIAPYAFRPSGAEPTPARESGAGSFAEFSLLGKHTTVLGVNILHGSASAVHRTMVGPYLRLGLGKWGVLAEHDITNRSLTNSTTSFLQHARLVRRRRAARDGGLLRRAHGHRLPDPALERHRGHRRCDPALRPLRSDLQIFQSHHRCVNIPLPGKHDFRPIRALDCPSARAQDGGIMAI